MKPKRVVLRFYKPYGVLTQFTDREGRPTLADYIRLPGVYAAGRLDMDSEGLLLLTNDPVLKTRLTEPRYTHPRTYWAQVERIPDASALERLRAGIILKDYTTRPAQARLLESEPDLPPRHPPIRFRQHIPTAWLELTLTEGKNRQVRHMTAAVGHPTLRLVRWASGPITLAGLALGQAEALTPDEQQRLYRALHIS
jgi:23S rRNA pseudouridine2457 synthase